MENIIKLIANNMTKNTMTNIYSNISFFCKYISNGYIVANNKQKVQEFFDSRQRALVRDSVDCFAYPAVVTESLIASIPVGTPCVILTQFDKYNCVGFMTIQKNIFGKIKRFKFHTTPKVKFKVISDEKFSITHVPEDAHDAISYRAFALGIMNEKVILSKHIQRYDVFQEYVIRTYHKIYNSLGKNGFNEGITNAAGYLYTVAMATAFERNTGKLLISYDEKLIFNKQAPSVEQAYQEWIDTGFETGKKLFLGFIEFVNLRSPKESTFVEQMNQSYLDICLYGSTQANRDYDSNLIK